MREKVSAVAYWVTGHVLSAKQGYTGIMCLLAAGHGP